MAKPTVAEMTTMVYDAFKKLGFGSPLSTYNVIDHAPYLELTKYNGCPNVCFKVLSKEEFDERAINLEQNLHRSVLEVVKRKLGTEKYTVGRLAQNMVAKLVRTTPHVIHQYYDTARNTFIVKYGNVIVEVCNRIDYNVDITSQAVFDYLDELKEVIDLDGDLTNIEVCTDLGKVKILIKGGDVVETDCSVEEFNKHWEK